MNSTHPNDLPIWGLILIALVLLIQSTYLFVAAKKQGRNQWFWGIVGLIQFPFPTLIFLLLNWKIWKRRE